jgi:protein-S-isoprenylcysteine O-methyltransferase Ste14
MPLALPIGFPQFWLFNGLSLLFFAFLIRAFWRRDREANITPDRRSRRGIILQSIGIGLAGFGPARVTLEPLSAASLLGCALVILLMGAAIGLFAASTRALGRNWSIIARTRSDHELIQSGPYAHVRHPIYLGLLFFLLGLSAALGHWLQLIVAVPMYLAGTMIRTRLEDRLLEQSFGDKFRDYRSATRALIPKII